MGKSIVIIAENDNYVVKGMYADWNTRSMKTRLSADIKTEDMVAAIGEAPAYSIKGEDPENDAAWKAYNRAEVREMKKLIMTVNEQLGFLPKDGFKVSFSRTAGCSCGCSPAFILTINGRRLPAPASDTVSIDRFRGFESVWIVTK